MYSFSNALAIPVRRYCSTTVSPWTQTAVPVGSCVCIDSVVRVVEFARVAFA